MRIYKDLEITKVAGLMDSIIMQTSLMDICDDISECGYVDAAVALPEMFEDSICFIADDGQSFLFAHLDKENYRIQVAMWAAVDDKLSFKQTMQYFRELKRVFAGKTNTIVIQADCRTTTSLPIINKLDGRKGIMVVHRGPEDNGFVPVIMFCGIE